MKVRSQAPSYRATAASAGRLSRLLTIASVCPPWSRCGFDGLANLVAADVARYMSKSGALPDPSHVRRAMMRGSLEQLAEVTSWSQGVQRDRMRKTALGRYRFLPTTTVALEG